MDEYEQSTRAWAGQPPTSATLGKETETFELIVQQISVVALPMFNSFIMFNNVLDCVHLRL